MNDINLDNINFCENTYNTDISNVIQEKNISEYNIEKNTYKPFAHLHLHTFHSILDGCGNVDDYIKLAKKYNQPAIAITDHGTMSGTFDFYKKCKKHGIKPIIGMEAYVNDDMGEFEDKKYEGGNSHQIILVKNKQGFINLNKLAYMSYKEGFYRRGRIKTQWLIENKEGLIITTSCMGSYMGKLLFENRGAEAELYFKKLKYEFGDDFYAELNLNELKDQKIYNSFILNMATKYNVKTIITNDVHYAGIDDSELQDTLIAVNQKKSLSESFKLDARNLFFCSSNDIYKFNYRFGYDYRNDFIDYCFKNSLEIVDKCNFDFEIGFEKYPKYEPTKDVIDFFKTTNTNEIGTKLAFLKLKQKLNRYKEKGELEITKDVIKKYVDRLNYELKIIINRGVLDYFLVNWEILRYYRSKGHDTGVARGSAAGSLLSWCLDIVKIDPIKFNLYFERFLNPERKGLPDIDIDFETDTDHITEEFLLNKYGENRILHVSTFSTFSEKNTLKDVVRSHYGQDATGFDSVVFQITKEMPNWLTADFTLKEWFETWPKNKECSPAVKQWLTDPNNKKILEQTLKLQGQIRGIGQHAAGVVITPSECWNDVPTNIIPKEKSIVTAFSEADGSGKHLSELGILKLDMLKLTTLNVIKETIDLVKQKKGINIKEKVEHLDLNDSNIYKELMGGFNHGVFQLESVGMNSLVKGINVENFDEISAAVSLYRPGPKSIGADEQYIKNKHNPKNISYIHPILEEILGETNGVMIYQEQVMFIANKIGGMTLGDGDVLRRYMDKASKLILKEAEGEKLTEKEINSDVYQTFKNKWDEFLNGAKKNGYSDDVINKIKNWMIKYLGYSFNKSHCVSYSYIACQTLFLKHYYPTEFYTSLLNHPKKGTGSNAKREEMMWLTSTITGAMSKGIRIMPPSTKSGLKWTMTNDKEISVGLAGINGLGDKAYNELHFLLNNINETLETIKIINFFSLPFSKFNKTAFESCVKAGVFDSWSDSREYLLYLKNLKKKKQNIGQMALFDINSDDFDNSITNTKFPPTSDSQKTKEFVEVCNFDLKKIEEIAIFRKELKEKANREIESILNFDGDDYYFFYLDSCKEEFSKKGTAYFTLKVGDGINTTTIRSFPPRTNGKDKIYDFIKQNTSNKGYYIAQFVKSDKGFINFKNNGNIKRIK